MTLMQPLKIYMVFTQIIKKVYLMPMFQNLQKKNKNKKISTSVTMGKQDWSVPPSASSCS